MKQLLKKLNACKPAQIWIAEKSWNEIYKTCDKGDWLLWLFERVNPNDDRLLMLVKGHCASTVLYLMEDERSKNAVQAALDFGNGKISKPKLDDTIKYAGDAFIMAWNNYKGDAQAYAAGAACMRNSSFIYDIGDAQANIERAQKQTADICRKYLPINIWKI